MHKNSLSAIKYSLFSLALALAIAILSFKMNYRNSYITSIIIGVCAFVIVISSIIGLRKSIKSYQEPKKFKFFLGLQLIHFFYPFILILYSLTPSQK